MKSDPQLVFLFGERYGCMNSKEGLIVAHYVLAKHHRTRRTNALGARSAGIVPELKGPGIRFIVHR